MGVKNETARHIKAYEYWFSLDKRSYRKVAKQFNVSITAVANWARTFNWEERAREGNQKILEKTEEKVTDTIAEMNIRHINFAKSVLEEIKEEIKKFKPTSLYDLVRIGEIVIKIERIARGEATERQEVKADVGFGVDWGLTDEQEAELEEAFLKIKREEEQ